MLSYSEIHIEDYALAVVATLSALFLYAEIAKNCHSTHRIWRAFVVKHDVHEMLPMVSIRQTALWMMALGWTMFSIRMWWLLIVVGDAPIATISVVSLTLIGCGTIMLQLFRTRLV